MYSVSSRVPARRKYTGGGEEEEQEERATTQLAWMTERSLQRNTERFRATVAYWNDSRDHIPPLPRILALLTRCRDLAPITFHPITVPYQSGNGDICISKKPKEPTNYRFQFFFFFFVFNKDFFLLNLCENMRLVKLLQFWDWYLYVTSERSTIMKRLVE